MEKNAEELYESWVNGNRSYVVDEVIGSSCDASHVRAARSAALAVLIAAKLTDRDRAVFVRLLEART